MGFKDIEIGEDLLENCFEVKGKHNQTEDTFKANQNYYSWARSKVNEGRFDSTKSQLIWEYHSEGMPRRQIAPRVGYEHSHISRKIQKITRYLKAQATGSGSQQLDLFFWSTPWEFVK